MVLILTLIRRVGNNINVLLLHFSNIIIYVMDYVEIIVYRNLHKYLALTSLFCFKTICNYCCYSSQYNCWTPSLPLWIYVSSRKSVLKLYVKHILSILCIYINFININGIFFFYTYRQCDKTLLTSIYFKGNIVQYNY